MSFENTILKIKKLHKVLSVKESDIQILYKGTAYGVSEPWLVRIDIFEAKAVSCDDAANKLYKLLQEEINKKIRSMQEQIDALSEVLSN